MIYHIADEAGWENALHEGSYEHPTLKTEGFIHTCEVGQITSVRNRYYRGIASLLLLHIDESLVASQIKYELSPSVNETFPHIYGPLNTSAVIKTEII